MGVPTKSTGDAIRDKAAERFDDPDEDDVWQVAEDLRYEHGPAGPTIACRDWITKQTDDVICVSDLREQEEVNWLRSNVGPVLCVLIDADTSERVMRYVERKLDVSSDVVSEETITELAEELGQRQGREAPYPQHDVRVVNSDSVDVEDLWTRFDHLLGVIRE